MITESNPRIIAFPEIAQLRIRDINRVLYYVRYELWDLHENILKKNPKVENQSISDCLHLEFLYNLFINIESLLSLEGGNVHKTKYWKDNLLIIRSDTDSKNWETTQHIHSYLEWDLEVEEDHKPPPFWDPREIQWDD